MANNDEVIIAAAACVIICAKKKTMKRRFWVRPLLQSWKRYSGSDLLADLKRDDNDLIDSSKSSAVYRL